MSMRIKCGNCAKRVPLANAQATCPATPSLLVREDRAACTAYQAARNCGRCKHHLGGGACRVNGEAECREGGGYELWEAASITKAAHSLGG